MIACLGSLNVNAQAGFTWNYEPRALGAADRHGYVFYTVPLAKLNLDGANIPLRAEFTSDPRPIPSPSPLGRGWSVNFFSSALIEEDQNTLRWHRPDGRIFFFSLERGKTEDHKRGANDPIVFQSTKSTWIATKEPKKRVITLTHSESGSEFLYDDGLLVRFKFSKQTKDAESYTISYNRLRRPARLAVIGSGKILAEFTYNNPQLATILSLDTLNTETVKPIVFEYTSAELNQFDSGPYLSKIGDNGLTPLNISYLLQKQQANRINLERTKERTNTSFVWSAISGFILEDEAASYNVENPSLSSHGKASLNPMMKNQSTNYNWRPDEAKVTRKDISGNTEYRFYDSKRGTLTEKFSNGTTLVTSYILTTGTIYGKIRKIEEIDNTGLSKIVLRNSYDDKQRLLRKIDEFNNTELSIYDDIENTLSFFRNGKLLFIETYSKNYNGALIKRMQYGHAGIREDYYDEQSGSLIKSVMNGTVLIEKIGEEKKWATSTHITPTSILMYDPKNPGFIIRAR